MNDYQDVLNRRAATRVEKVIPIAYRNQQFWNSNSLDYTPSYALDLSTDGARLVTREDSDLGNDIKMTFRLEDGKTVTVTGRKVWEQPISNGRRKVVGVAFVSTGLGGRSAIGRWVDEQQATH